LWSIAALGSWRFEWDEIDFIVSGGFCRRQTEPSGLADFINANGIFSVRAVSEALHRIGLGSAGNILDYLG
jgi:hypothetical protein